MIQNSIGSSNLKSLRNVRFKFGWVLRARIGFGFNVNAWHWWVQENLNVTFYLAAITRNSPDATETVIHVLEGMATVNRDGSRRRQHEQEALLGYSPAVSRSRLQNIRGQPNSSGPAQPTNKNSTDQSKQVQWKEQENKKKTEINELNQPLERLLPCQDLWEALSNSLRKCIVSSYEVRWVSSYNILIQLN